MSYELILKPTAEKQFAKLSKQLQKRIYIALTNLVENPKPHGSLKIQGSTDLYRIRVGDYRIIYSIQEHQLMIYIINIDHRSRVYK